MSKWSQTMFLSRKDGLKKGFHPGYDVLSKGLWVWDNHMQGWWLRPVEDFR